MNYSMNKEEGIISNKQHWPIIKGSTNNKICCDVISVTNVELTKRKEIVNIFVSYNLIIIKRRTRNWIPRLAFHYPNPTSSHNFITLTSSFY